MCRATHLTRMTGVVETNEYTIKTCFFVLPDDKRTIEFSNGAVRVDLVNQCRSASG